MKQINKILTALSFIFLTGIFTCTVHAQTMTYTSFPINPSQINVLRTDTLNNQLYVGGTFSGTGTIAASNIACWDGTTWSNLGVGTNGKVSALAMYNNELYVGGSFTTAGGIIVNGIAKWNGTTWSDVGSGISINGGGNVSVNALAVFNGELYATGYFDAMNGISTNGIAKWNGTTWSPLGTGLSLLGNALHVFQNKLYVGGNFLFAGGMNCSHIATWDGTTWDNLVSSTTMSTGVNSSVSALSEYDGKLILGGNFTSSGSATLKRIASWDGATFENLGEGFDNSVKSLAVYDCELYASGSFDLTGTVDAFGLAHWNGNNWIPLNTFMNNNANNSLSINALEVFNNDLAIGAWQVNTYVVGILAGSLGFWNTPTAAIPAATFYSSSSSIAPGSYVQYNNTSSNTSVLWNFPGGIPSSSTDQNPVVQYPNPGIYDVTQTVSNCVSDDTQTTSAYVSVNDTLPAIPNGESSELLLITPPTSNHTYGYENLYEIHYYKPPSYDSLTSPILMYIHGSGSTGASSSFLQDMADRQKALIVAPTMVSPWAYLNWEAINITTGCSEIFWATELTKQIYRHVLVREDRDSIPVYLTGFSAGAQFTSRYMFVRQFAPDTIPIVMSLAANGGYYSFMTESLFGAPLDWSPGRCGIGGDQVLSSGCATAETIPFLDYICEGHIKQYYNENMAVICGTADLEIFAAQLCPDSAQGNTRYERMQRFYNFSDSNAVTRGTTLQWEIDSVQGVGHTKEAMYNTFLNPTDTATIAENLLFNTPWHPVPQFAPLASFTSDTTVVSLSNSTVQFTNNSTPGTYYWDFGDGTTSTDVDPNHTYMQAGVYSVSLTVDGPDCSDSLIQVDYIIVNDDADVFEHDLINFEFSVSPNPFTHSLEVNYSTSSSNSAVRILITDVLGRIIDSHSFDNSTGNSMIFNTSSYARTMYFCSLVVDGQVLITRKIVSVN